MQKAEVQTKELIRQASRVISRADAEFLMMTLLGKGRHALHENTVVTAAVVARFRRCVERVRSGEPAQYAVGTAPFMDFDVRVDPRVMIPRPETEELVLRAVNRMSAAPRSHDPSIPRSLAHPSLCLDFGTGSGCIAIALCRLWPGVRVLAVDCSPGALAVAQRNARTLRVASRIRFVLASSLDSPLLSRYQGRVDLLISNPPYIPGPRLSKLDPRVREHEPAIALDGGPKGTNIVAMLLALGPALLRPGGLLALEVDSSHRRFLSANALRLKLERDLAGRTRYAFWHRPLAP